MRGFSKLCFLGLALCTMALNDVQRLNLEYDDYLVKGKDCDDACMTALLEDFKDYEISLVEVDEAHE